MVKARVRRGATVAMTGVLVLVAAACQVDLKTLGGNRSVAYGINAAGQVVGGSETAFNGSNPRAFVSDPDNAQALSPLSISDEVSSQAWDINDRGDIVGDLVWPGFPVAAWAKPAGGSITPLRLPGQSFPTANGSEAMALNEQGFAVGYARVEQPGGFSVDHAVRWNIHTGEYLDLDGTTGWSRAAGINEVGQIVGWSDRGPFLWDPARPGLQILPGGEGGATDINDTGDIVGFVGRVGLPTGTARQAHWRTATRELTVLRGLGDQAQLTAVNDAGVAAGWSQQPGSEKSHAVRVTLATGEVRDLGTPGFSSRGYDINAGGTVVGDSSTSSGTARAALWTP